VNAASNANVKSVQSNILVSTYGIKLACGLLSEGFYLDINPGLDEGSFDT